MLTTRTREAIALALGLTATLITAGCSSSKSTAPPDPHKPVRTTAAVKAGRTIEVAGRKHKVIAFTGYLEIDPYPTGKAVQGTRVITKDGRGYLLAIRRYGPYLKFVNRWVTGTGYHHRSSYDSRAQSIGMFTTLSLRLADGQLPHASVPTRVPHPPRARTRAELERLPGRWALVIEKPTYELQKPRSANPPFQVVKSVTMTLPGGLQVKKHLWLGVSKQSARRMLAAGQATLVVRISRRAGKLTVSASEHCEGVAIRCGMDKRRRRTGVPPKTLK